MTTPAFFDDVAPFEVMDLLAALLGAVEGGWLQYHYLDAVKLSKPSHSIDPLGSLGELNQIVAQPGVISTRQFKH